MEDSFPFPILTVREEPLGGNLSQVVHIDKRFAAYSPQGKARVVIFIHGFNVPFENAKTSYLKMIKHLAEAQGAQGILDSVVAFVWPGDWKHLSAFSYPVKIKVAVEAGALLAKYLGQFTGPLQMPLEVIFIAHSLGNRVAFECIKAFSNIGITHPVSFRCLCSMAAAVSEQIVGDGGGLHVASMTARKRVVMHSTKDDVLRFAFPPGEFAGGEGWGTAIGRYGKPEENWSEPSKDMSGFGYGHGSYWEGAESADIVAQSLGLVVPRTVNTSLLVSRELPPPRNLAARTLVDRIMGTRQIGFGI